MATAAAGASLALHCGRGKAFLCGEDGFVGRCGPLYPRRSRLVASKRRWAVTAALATEVGPPQHAAGRFASSILVDPLALRLPPRSMRVMRLEEENEGRGGDAGRDPVPPEKLDEWMRESVVEIVRNIGEAPFLVNVFSTGGSSSSSNNKGPGGEPLRLEREAAHAGSWPQIRRRWSTGAAPLPDGVILVEELKGEEARREGHAASGDDAAAAAGSSKTWGLLVQGRGGGAGGAACYILNTCRVGSAVGFCTHFCLARAKCFGETADVQLKKVWLQAPQQRSTPHC